MQKPKKNKKKLKQILIVKIKKIKKSLFLKIKMKIIPIFQKTMKIS